MLNPGFKDMLSCLKSEEVDFIVVGAYALAAQGFPRATGDIAIGNLAIDVLSKKDLLRNKLATGRDKDQGDTVWLAKNQSDEA